MAGLASPSRPLLLACLVALLAAQQLSSPAAAAAADLPTQAARPSIIAVGDGLTEGAFKRDHDGWGLQLQERYTRKADVVNRGFGGYFTSWLVDYTLEQLFNVANPTMAILFLGTKDTLTQAVSGSHYTSPEQFGANVDKILLAAKAVGVKHLLLITPPPVCEACKQGAPKPWDRENAHTRLYVAALQGLAKKHGAGLLNIFDDWQKDPAWADKLLQPDKLHLSSAGNSLLYSQIMSTIEGQVPAMAWANVPLHYPLMDAIDKDNPGPAFSKVQRSSKSSLRMAGTDSSSIVDASSSSSAAGPSPCPEQPVFVAGKSEAARREQGQQQGASSAALAAQGAGWLLLGVVVTAWQLFHI